MLILQAPADGLIYAIECTYLFGGGGGAGGTENSLRNAVILGLLSNLPQVKQAEILSAAFSDRNKMPILCGCSSSPARTILNNSISRFNSQSHLREHFAASGSWLTNQQEACSRTNVL